MHSFKYIYYCAHCVPTQNVLLQVVSGKFERYNSKGNFSRETPQMRQLQPVLQLSPWQAAVRSQHKTLEGHHQHQTKECHCYCNEAGTRQEAFIWMTYLKTFSPISNFYPPSSKGHYVWNTVHFSVLPLPGRTVETLATSIIECASARKIILISLLHAVNLYYSSIRIFTSST